MLGALFLPGARPSSWQFLVPFPRILSVSHSATAPPHPRRKYPLDGTTCWPAPEFQSLTGGWRTGLDSCWVHLPRSVPDRRSGLALHLLSFLPLGILHVDLISPQFVFLLYSLLFLLLLPPRFLLPQTPEIPTPHHFQSLLSKDLIHHCLFNLPKTLV